jgi:hypothetical protein
LKTPRAYLRTTPSGNQKGRQGNPGTIKRRDLRRAVAVVNVDPTGAAGGWMPGDPAQEI